MLSWVIAGLALVVAGWLAWRYSRTRAAAQIAAQHAAHAQRDQQSRIAALEQLQNGILRAVDDALLVLDANQRILVANMAAEALLGQELVGRTLMEAIRQPDLENLIQDAQMVRGEGVERRIEYNRLILNVRAVVELSQESTEPIVVLSLRDVTEIQRLERARREMVSNITHELSTPITAIGLLADTLVHGAAQGKVKKSRKIASEIRREVDTLTQLVQEMRDLSLIESGQMPVRLTPSDLLSIVTAAVEPLQTLAENKEQTIVIDVPDNILVLADDLQIRRAIKNIVHNAVKFSPNGGRILISATTNEDEAIVSVQDNGPGIPAADLERIFERFFQVDRARRAGTGLGLAIVRHIVLAHGGRVWVESVEGEGATFYFALALAEPIQSLPHG